MPSHTYLLSQFHAPSPRIYCHHSPFFPSSACGFVTLAAFAAGRWVDSFCVHITTFVACLCLSPPLPPTVALVLYLRFTYLHAFPRLVPILPRSTATYGSPPRSTYLRQLYLLPTKRFAYTVSGFYALRFWTWLPHSPATTAHTRVPAPDYSSF